MTFTVPPGSGGVIPPHHHVGGHATAPLSFAHMNLFRFVGDMAHVMSFIVLLLKIRVVNSCAGVSLKTQLLYLMVFVARYIDAVTALLAFVLPLLQMLLVSPYNTIMKLLFIGATGYTIWLMTRDEKIKRTYNKEQDSFRILFLIVPAAVLGVLTFNRRFAHGWVPMSREVLWTFSIYLEAVTILPQLIMLQHTRNIDNLTANYVFLLGTYRSFYILNWVYRYWYEGHVDWHSWIGGALQTALYGDFFYYYYLSWKMNTNFKLPS